MGDVSKIDRQAGRTRLSAEATALWASRQVRSVRRAKLDPEEKARFANLVLEYGGSIKGLPIARMNGDWSTTTTILKALHNIIEVVLINGHVFDADLDHVLKWEFEQHFTPNDDLIVLPYLYHSFQEPDASYLGKYLLRLCKSAWGNCEQCEENDRLVGHVNCEEIRRDTKVFRKFEPSSEPK